MLKTTYEVKLNNALEEAEDTLRFIQDKILYEIYDTAFQSTYNEYMASHLHHIDDTNDESYQSLEIIDQYQKEYEKNEIILTTLIDLFYSCFDISFRDIMHDVDKKQTAGHEKAKNELVNMQTYPNSLTHKMAGVN